MFVAVVIFDIVSLQLTFYCKQKLHQDAEPEKYFENLVLFNLRLNLNKINIGNLE